MGRPPTDPDKRMVGFTVKLTPLQYAFLEEQKEVLDVSFSADVVRQMVEELRTCYSLPEYQAQVILRDMASKKQTWTTYLRELLARRYEQLQQHPPAPPPQQKGKSK